MSLQLAIRFTDEDVEMLDRYLATHHLENRSQAVRHALRTALNLEADKVTKRVQHPPLGPVKRTPVDHGVAIHTARDENKDERERQKIMNRLPKKDISGAPPSERVEDEEGDKEYYAQVAQAQKQTSGVHKPGCGALDGFGCDCGAARV